MTQAENSGAFSFDLNPETDQPQAEVSSFDRQRAAVVEFLKNEGFRPDISETGRVYFKFEGHHVYFEANEKDDQQFSLMIPDVWPIAPEERDLAIRTAHFVSERFRCAKALVLENNEVWIVYDGFYGDVGSFTEILNRVVERLQYAARRFVDVFNETKKTRVLN